MYYSLQLTAQLARSESVSRNMIFLIFFLAVGRVAGEVSLSRRMYDSMARLVGEEEYPATWWQERQECLALISPSLTNRLELAWLGLIQYWEAGGAETDPWQTCDQQEHSPALSLVQIQRDTMLSLVKYRVPIAVS